MKVREMLDRQTDRQIKAVHQVTTMEKVDMTNLSSQPTSNHNLWALCS